MRWWIGRVFLVVPLNVACGSATSDAPATTTPDAATASDVSTSDVASQSDVAPQSDGRPSTCDDVPYVPQVSGCGDGWFYYTDTAWSGDPSHPPIQVGDLKCYKRCSTDADCCSLKCIDLRLCKGGDACFTTERVCR